MEWRRMTQQLSFSIAFVSADDLVNLLRLARSISSNNFFPHSMENDLSVETLFNFTY